MNWSRILLGGVVAGVAKNLVDFAMHVGVMSDTYARYDTVFVQEDGNPLWHFVIAMVAGVIAAYLFGKTRQNWEGRWKGGLFFGLTLGALIGFYNFFIGMVFQGFPYYLSWCWLGIELLGWGVLGVVLSLFIKRASA